MHISIHFTILLSLYPLNKHDTAPASIDTFLTKGGHQTNTNLAMILEKEREEKSMQIR